MGAEGRGLTAHEQLWLKRIETCEPEGISLVGYASAQGYPVRTLYGLGY